MNNSTNLPPLTPLSQSAKGKSNVRIAVITIIALHGVFFGGLLMQGCKQKTPDNSLAGMGGTNTSLALSNSPYGDLGGTGSLGGILNTDMTAGATNPGLAYTPPAPTNLGAPAAAVTPGTYQPTPAPGAYQPTPGAYQTPPTVAPTYAIPAPAPATEVAGTKEYSIQKGDTLATIAKAHGVPLKELQHANPNADSRRLKIGQKLTIPAAGSASTPTALAPAGGTGLAAAPAAENSHTVKAGDNLTKISQKYGVSIKAIRSANGLKTDRIHTGQKLKIPATGGA